MMFPTNKFNITLSNIEEYYDIFALKKIELNDKNYVNLYMKKADFLNHTFSNRIQSLIIRKRTLYLLFKKNDISLKELLENQNDYTVDKNPKMDKNHKVELLLNSINKIKNSSLCNIIGNTIRIVEQGKSNLICLEYKVEDDIITYKVKSLSKINNEADFNYNKSKTLYCCIGAYLQNYIGQWDESKEIYKVGGFNYSRHKVTFFDISTKDKFEKSKVGMLNMLLKDVEKYLSHVLSIKLIKKDYHVKDWKLLPVMKEAFLEHLHSFDIAILNSTNDHEAIDNLKFILQHALIRDRKCIEDIHFHLKEKPDPEMLNFHIVYSEEFYKVNKIEDAHITSLTYPIQHVILDHLNDDYKSVSQKNKDGKKCISNYGNKLLVESILKAELTYGISYMDVIYGILLPDWKYLYRHKKGSAERFFKLYIKNGEMNFSELQKSDWEPMVSDYRCDHVIIRDDGTSMEIIDTNEHPLPDYEMISNRFESCSKFKNIDKQELISYIDAFENDKKNELKQESKVSLFEKSMCFKSEIQKLGAIVTRNEINKALDKVKLNKKGFKYYGQFIKYFNQKTGNWIAPILKSSMEVTRQYISGYYKISFRIDEENENNMKYVVGKKKDTDFQNSLINSTLFKIVTNCDMETFKIFVNMLAVDFVRIDLYTVYPYPFKYLHEYAAAKVKIDANKKNSLV